jgi:hypothetical protein
MVFVMEPINLSPSPQSLSFCKFKMMGKSICFSSGTQISHLATMPCSEECPCFVGVGVLEGILYAVGGHDGPLVRKSVESYNPDTKTWSPVADMALCRRNAGMCAIFANIIIRCRYIIFRYAI